MLSSCRLLIGGPLDLDFAGIEPAGRGHHQQRCLLPLIRGGSRYQPDRNMAGTWMPDRQLPNTGVRAGSRLKGSRAREPLMPGAAVVPPSVPASVPVTRPSSLTKLRSPGRSITGSAETLAGIPLAVNPSDRPAPSASATGALTGGSIPASGSSSTSTSSASPQLLPVSACRLDRPTDHAGYCDIMPWVNETTSIVTSNQVAMASGAWTIGASRAPRRVLGGPSPVATKLNQAATTSTITDSSSSAVVSDHRSLGNEFDHGTPKLETYHQPLTLANDSAITNSTTAANTVRLRRERIATPVTATAASAPSEPASPANTPKCGSIWSG